MLRRSLTEGRKGAVLICSKAEIGASCNTPAMQSPSSRHTANSLAEHPRPVPESMMHEAAAPCAVTIQRGKARDNKVGRQCCSLQIRIETRLTSDDAVSSTSETAVLSLQTFASLQPLSHDASRSFEDKHTRSYASESLMILGLRTVSSPSFADLADSTRRKS